MNEIRFLVSTSRVAQLLLNHLRSADMVYMNFDGLLSSG